MALISFDIFARDFASQEFGKVSQAADANRRAFAAWSRGVGIAVAGAIATSSHMAADFQTSITKLQTSAGESHKNLGLVSQGILDMAGKVGYSAQQLADGMYTVESAGFHGKSALTIYQAAAKGAAIESADLGTVTDAVTSAMRDFHYPASKAALVTNTLIQAAAHGKTNMQNLSAAMPNVASAAADAGLSFQETASALATMTMHGTSAEEAGTYLRQMILALEAPSAKARKTMEGLGLNAEELGKNLGSKGLAYTMQQVEGAINRHMTPAGQVAIKTFAKSNATTKDWQKLLADIPPNMVSPIEAMANMSGGVRELQGWLQLGGKNLKVFKSNTQAIDSAVKKSGHQIDGFNAYNKTLNAKLRDAKGAMSALGVEVGTDLLPKITWLIGKVSSLVDWLGKHRSTAKMLIVTLGLLSAAMRVGAIVTEVHAAGSLKKYFGEMNIVRGVLSIFTREKKVATAATEAETVVTRTSTVATDAQTVSQEGLNTALEANPIGIVIVALAALGVGLYEAYKHSQTFRNIVNAAWHDVKVVGLDMIHGLIYGFTHIDDAWRTVGRFFGDVWQNYLRPVFKFVIDGFLNVAGTIIHAASDMFGWVPGVGGKLRSAAHQFDVFRNNVNHSLSGLNDRSITVSAGLTLSARNGSNKIAAMQHMGMASGGPVTGGVAGQDSVPRLLMPNEYVVRADGSNLGDAMAYYGYGMANGGPVLRVRTPGAGQINRGVNWMFGAWSQADKAEIKNAVLGLLGGSGGGAYTGGGGVGRWLGDVVRVLAMLHQPSSLAGGVLRRIQFESGGNPSAINLWDSNAAAGDPSRGLMQVIMSTFMAYGGPFRGLGIYNPMANIFAGLNYALHTYGSIAAIDPRVRPEGYDQGGWLMPGSHVVYNHTGVPERVLAPGQHEGITVKVYLGDKELRDIVRTEVRYENGQTARRILNRRTVG